VNTKRVWAVAFAFAFVLIGLFIALDMTGMMQGASDGATTAAMFIAGAAFAVWLSRRSRQTRH
jgi:peptidoglycan/LPS O-acetylase OafA/YrhL